MLVLSLLLDRWTAGLLDWFCREITACILVVTWFYSKTIRSRYAFTGEAICSGIVAHIFIASFVLRAVFDLF